MAPPSVGIQAARTTFGAVGPGGLSAARTAALARSSSLRKAVAQLVAAPTDVVAFAFTSSAYALGAAGEARFNNRLEVLAHVPVVATASSLVSALRALRARTLAVIHPPWFNADLNQLGRRYFEDHSFEVRLCKSAALPPRQDLIRPDDLFGWVVANVEADQVDAVVIAGNGFRAVGTIAALEAELARPVLTANQVLLWAALRALGGHGISISGYGQLLETPKV